MLQMISRKSNYLGELWLENLAEEKPKWLGEDSGESVVKKEEKRTRVEVGLGQGDDWGVNQGNGQDMLLRKLLWVWRDEMGGEGISREDKWKRYLHVLSKGWKVKEDM